jgi:WD40 repeat protein
MTFLTHGGQVSRFDLRKGAVIVADAVTSWAENADEVNEIALHPNGDYIAACDDAGEVTVLHVSSGTVYRTLRNKHKNIVASVCFHPTRNERAQISCHPCWLLIWSGLHAVVSGGLDQLVVHWDYNKIRSIAVLNFGSPPSHWKSFVTHTDSIDMQRNKPSRAKFSIHPWCIEFDSHRTVAC